MATIVLRARKAGEVRQESFPRDFRLYAASQAVSIAGDRVALIALVFLVIRVSHAFAPGLALFYVCQLLPTLAGGLVVGEWVDRLDRRRVMLVADLVRAGIVVLIPIVTALSLSLLYPAVFVLYACTLFFDTASRAAIPDVVSEPQLLRANALLNSLQTGGDIFYAIGGFMVLALPSEVPFWLDAISFAVSAALIFRIQPLPATNRLHLEPALERIRGGVSFLFSEPFLKWSTLTFAVAPLAGGMTFVALPLYASHALGHSGGLIGPLSSGAFRFSVLEVCTGLGALAGSRLITALARIMPRGAIFGAGISAMGLLVLTYAFTRNFYVAAVITLLAGIANSFFVVAGMTLVQSLTPSEMRGRVVAARSTIINVSLGAGSLLAGLLLLRLNYATLWFIDGLLMAAGSLFVWLHRDARTKD